MEAEADLLRSLTELANRSPDAFVLLYFKATTLLVQLDRAGYEFLMAGVMVRTFRASGLLEAMDQLKSNLTDQNVPGSLERTEAIRNWIVAIERLASQESLQRLLSEHQSAATDLPPRVPYIM